MPVDEAIRQLLSAMAESFPKPLHELSIADARAAVSQDPDTDMYEESHLKIEVVQGEIELIILKPTSSPRSIIVFYHGGGWVLLSAGNPGYIAIGKELASKTNATVVLVNYRKAPEYPFPTPIEDSYKALNWVNSHKTDLASEQAPIIVAGDSAGGTIAAAMAHYSKKKGGPTINLQVLIYPVTAMDTGSYSFNHPDFQLILTKPTMEWFWNLYVNNERDKTNALALPGLATSFEGLPPRRYHHS